MKKILFASFAALFILSCNRDDNNTTTSTSDSVVGIWKLTTFIILDGKDK